MSEEQMDTGLEMKQQVERTCDRNEEITSPVRMLRVLLDPEVEYLCLEWAEVARAVLTRRRASEVGGQ